MQALNHVAFGTLIALTIKQPVLVAPLALSSHFFLDILPHYGEDPKAPKNSAPYHFRILIDGLASLLFIALSSSTFPEYMPVILVGSFFAILPDFFWPAALFIKSDNPLWKFLKFHKRIQKFESRRGIYVEVGWFSIISIIIINFFSALKI